jgi:hypothetical protein
VELRSVVFGRLIGLVRPVLAWHGGTIFRIRRLVRGHMHSAFRAGTATSEDVPGISGAAGPGGQRHGLAQIGFSPYPVHRGVQVGLLAEPAGQDEIELVVCPVGEGARDGLEVLGSSHRAARHRRADRPRLFPQPACFSSSAARSVAVLAAARAPSAGATSSSGPGLASSSYRLSHIALGVGLLVVLGGAAGAILADQNAAKSLRQPWRAPRG